MMFSIISGIVMELIVIGLITFGISALMEWYKKVVRKDTAELWEIRVVAAAASLISSLGLVFTGLLYFPGSGVWYKLLGSLVYAACIFTIQMEVDMKLVKQVIQHATSTAVKTGELTAELKTLLDSFKNNTGVDAREVMAALKTVGLTEDGVRKVLEEIGVEASKIDELVEAYKKYPNV